MSIVDIYESDGLCVSPYYVLKNMLKNIKTKKTIFV